MHTLLLAVGPGGTPSVSPTVSLTGPSSGGASSASGLSSGELATLIVTLVVAIIAAIAAIAAAIIARRGVNATNDAARAAADREYVLRQYNELYGPLYMNRVLSERLRHQLPQGELPKSGQTHWRLIDHIVVIKNEHDGARRAVVEKILKINDELTELIIGKGGLLEDFPPPTSFNDFLEHAATLRMLWAQGENGAGATDKSFPPQFDVDVEAALKRLRAKLDVQT